MIWNVIQIQHAELFWQVNPRSLMNKTDNTSILPSDEENKIHYETLTCSCDSQPIALRWNREIDSDSTIASVDSSTSTGVNCFTARICFILLVSLLGFISFPAFQRMKGTSAGWKKTFFPLSLNLSHLSFSLCFPLHPTLRVWVRRKRWVTGKAQCVCRGLWASCSSCCSIRRWHSASRWWSERLRIWPSSHGSQELQVKAVNTSSNQLHECF